MTKKATPKASDVLDKLSATDRQRPDEPGAPELATLVVDAARSKKAKDIVVIDLRGISEMSDFFVLCTGESDNQVKAIADGVRSSIMDACEERPWRTEGYTERQWVLMDYVDVVVHVFDHEHRDFYNLERLWADAKIERVADDEGVVGILN
jgi:ribosome-associated protein